MIPTLQESLADAIEGMEDMIAYVPDYFREKWGHDDYIARAKAALAHHAFAASFLPCIPGDQQHNGGE